MSRAVTGLCERLVGTYLGGEFRLHSRFHA